MFLNERLIVGCLITLAIALGVASIFVLGKDNIAFSDTYDYIVAAKSLLGNGTYPNVGSLPFFRAPLYPIFIALIWSAVPESIFAVKLVQVAMHAGVVVFVYVGSKLIWENWIAAGISGLLVAINPFFLYHAAAIQTEALHTFLVTLGVLVIVALTAGHKRFFWLSIGGGLVFGLAALCKPSALGLGVVAAALMLFLRSGSDRRITLPILFVASMFATILPWSFYNLATKGEFILVNDAGGYALWLGNHEANLRTYEESFDNLKDLQDYHENVSKTVTAKQIEEWNVTKGYSELSLGGREALWRDAAIEKARNDPSQAIRLDLWKLWGFWKPNLNRDVYGRTASILSGLFMLPLYLFGAVGLALTASEIRTRKIAWLFVAMAIFITAVHVLIVSNLRLRIPYIDPWLMAFAGFGLTSVCKKFVGRLKGNEVSREAIHC